MHPIRALSVVQKNYVDVSESRIMDCLAIWFVKEVIVNNSKNIKQVGEEAFSITTLNILSKLGSSDNID